jgi:hypothetical protein
MADPISPAEIAGIQLTAKSQRDDPFVLYAQEVKLSG